MVDCGLGGDAVRYRPLGWLALVMDTVGGTTGGPDGGSDAVFNFPNGRHARVKSPVRRSTHY